MKKNEYMNSDNKKYDDEKRKNKAIVCIYNKYLKMKNNILIMK